MSKNKSFCALELPAMKKLPTDSESLAANFEHYLMRHMGRFVGCIPY